MLRFALTATSLALSAVETCAQGVAHACEIGITACWATRVRVERRRYD